MVYMEQTEGAGTEADREKAIGVLSDAELACGLHTVSSTTKMNRGPQPCPQDITSSQIVVYSQMEARIHTECGTAGWKGDGMPVACHFAAFGSARNLSPNR